MKYLTKSISLVFCILLATGQIVCAQGWVQKGLDIDGEAAQDRCGRSVSMCADGNTVAVGSPFNDAYAFDAGHVRVFDYNGIDWVQRGGSINGEFGKNEAGASVSLSADGNRVAIGSPGYGLFVLRTGHVRIFNWSGNAWIQLGTDIVGEAFDDRSGTYSKLSANGNIVAIGSIYNDGNGSNSGHVRMYEWGGIDWIQMGQDIDGEFAYDVSGRVSLDSTGHTLAIGAPSNDDNGVNAGHVRVFDWDSTAWVQRGVDIDGEAAGDVSGLSVSLSANGLVLAIGAALNDGNGMDAGHVRVYEWDSTMWVQKGLDIDGEAADDKSGWSVSLNGDGNTVAIGAPNNDIGINTNAGHVRIYDWDGLSWIQRGADIDGENASDGSGDAVDINAIGNSVIIASDNNNDAGTSAGHARIFTYCDLILGTSGNTICDGDSLVLFGTSYTYSVNGVAHFFMDTTNNTCDSVFFVNLNVITIDKSISATIPVLTSNHSNASYYQWLDCDNNMAPIPGENAQSLTITANGNYAVAITQNNCIDTSVCFMALGVGINSNTILSEVIIYPNPNDGNFTIDLGKKYSDVNVLVKNVLGQIVLIEEYDKMERTSLTISGESGIYLVEISIGSTIRTNLRVLKNE